MSDVTIIIIAYKSEKMIKDFIKKIPSTIKTIIIDNSQNYKLKKSIEEEYRNISVYLKENDGVSSALNCAVDKIKTKYFLQISPDLEFNFKDLNISFPIIMNQGPKGLALKQLCKGMQKPIIFIDDNLSQIESAKKFVPSIYRFHFTGCDLVRKFLPKSLAATHNPKSWQEIEILCNRFLI